MKNPSSIDRRTPRPAQGRQLFYLRDSGGRHETTPGEFVRWAMAFARRQSLHFAGTPELITTMIRQGRVQCGDLFLDWGVPGNQMSRPGLDALLLEARQDRSVSHILTPRPDRLARPDQVEVGVALERMIRQDIGVDLVFRNRVCPRLARGETMTISEWLQAAIEYDAASKFRRELAEKMILSQLALAKQGFATGGRPKYGLQRWLIDPQGQRVRPLADKEYVRQAGHHVAWLPREDGTYEIRCRIKRDLAKMPATQLARLLTAEGVATPDAGRQRHDQGVLHPTSGVWHATTLTNIGRDSIDSGTVTHGRRSMGDRQRLTPDGPRNLDDDDYRAGTDTPKVIANPASQQVTGPAHFAGRVTPAEQEDLNRILDERGSSQRGKPRSHTPAQNPLGGGRIFDMTCGWPMYRAPHKRGFHYRCGLYTQSHGAACCHNHVDGPTAVRFVLSALRQQILSPAGMTKVRQRLEALAKEHLNPDSQDQRKIEALRARLAETRTQRATVGKNMALANSPEVFAQVSKVFEDLTAAEKQLASNLEAHERQVPPATDPKAGVEAALEVIGSLSRLIRNLDDMASAATAFTMTNARLFFRFGPVTWGKRSIRQATGGILTFGQEPPPVPIYQGPTARWAVKGGVDTAKKA